MTASALSQNAVPVPPVPPSAMGVTPETIVDVPAVPLPPESATTTKTVTSSVTLEQDRPWFSRHLRNVIAVILTLDVSYIALVLHNEAAIAAIVAMLATLAGAIWGERGALKVPGRDT